MSEPILMRPADGGAPEDWSGYMKELPERLHPIAMQMLRFYQQPGNAVGGLLHIVLEDKNWQREHVEWCRKQASAAGDTAAVELADALLALDDEDRQRVL